MENRELWERLNMDLDKHDEFLAPLPQVYTELFLNRKNRPAAMGYFDFVVGDVHGIRVHELYAMKEAGAEGVFHILCLCSGGNRRGNRERQHRIMCWSPVYGFFRRTSLASQPLSVD